MPARSKGLAPRSAKTTVLLREYSKAADAYLAPHPVCEHPDGCLSRDVDVHHKGGRGARLMDESLWAAACYPHNLEAEDEPDKSNASGWRVNRVAGRAA